MFYCYIKKKIQLKNLSYIFCFINEVRTYFVYVLKIKMSKTKKNKLKFTFYVQRRVLHNVPIIAQKTVSVVAIICVVEYASVRMTLVVALYAMATMTKTILV